MKNPDSEAVNHVLRAILFSSLVWIGFIALSCSTRPQAMSHKSLDVFAGFTFVGSGPYMPGAPATGGISEVLPRHGIAELPLPEGPQVGIQYVFHHRRPLDNEKLALVDFPTRLQSAGITVVRAPKSSMELMHLFIGGPLFRIQIRDGGHEGIIYNQLCPDLQASSVGQEWTIEDYVLLWLK
jgi:hypothetical protein